MPAGSAKSLFAAALLAAAPVPASAQQESGTPAVWLIAEISAVRQPHTFIHVIDTLGDCIAETQEVAQEHALAVVAICADRQETRAVYCDRPHPRPPLFDKTSNCHPEALARVRKLAGKALSF